MPLWVNAVLQLTASMDVVVCAAGGWTGGSIDDLTVFDSVDLMHTACLKPAVLSSHIASWVLKKPGGLLVLTGAAAALSPTPSMIGYGLAKSATAFLVQSFGADVSDAVSAAAAWFRPCLCSCCCSGARVLWYATVYG